MRLSEFIHRHLEEILVECGSFAQATRPASNGPDASGWREQARAVLVAVAHDLDADRRTGQAQVTAAGRAPRPFRSPVTAAEVHDRLRATGGFSLQRMVGEYQALRASVLRLWAAQQDAGPDTLQDMVRFNEAIDQAVAESVDYFGHESDRWRHVFLGVLGHDLRTPLTSVLLLSGHLSELVDGPLAHDTTARLVRSAGRMKQLLDDLLEYSRASLDLGVPVHPAPMDLEASCREQIELERAAWPSHRIELHCEGETEGVWDASRIRQALGYLVANAVKYGDRDAPIAVRIDAEGPDPVILSVENSGPPIADADLHSLFEPLRRGGEGDAEVPRSSLGIGLFIVREIVRAHGGSVAASCRETRTVFSMTLPREIPPRKNPARDHC